MTVTLLPSASRARDDLRDAGDRWRASGHHPPHLHMRSGPAIAVCCTKWESSGIVLPMETSIDSVGRIVVPKPLRDALGLTPGATVDISRYGAGLQILPSGRTARLVDEAGVLVATGETTIDDQVVFGLIDSARR